MIHLTTGKPGEGMTYVCTSPTRKNEAARSLAAPVASESGACAAQNRHQLRRSAWYTRSWCLILSSLTASITAMTNTAHAATAISRSSESTSLTSCMAVPPEFWTDFASSFAQGLLWLVLPCFLAAQLVWSVFIVPLVNRWADRSIASKREGQ